MNLLDLARLIMPASVRKTIGSTRFAIRRHAMLGRVLPDFLLIGTMRGGTSSLFKYLSVHPCVIPSLRKEIWYFSNPKNYRKGENWYRAHFPSSIYKRVLGSIRQSKILSFEASANYIYDPYAAELASQLIPNAKLILMLRNPIERLYSHYVYNVRKGIERRSLEQIVEESAPYGGMSDWDFRGSLVYGRAIHHAFMYYYIGLYAVHLEAWLRYYPIERFLIVKSEEFFSRTAETYQQILQFLQLPDWRPSSFRNYSYWGNKIATKRNSESEIPESILEKLKVLYEPHNERLYRLVGRDFNWN